MANSDIDRVWTAAVEVTAVAYGVPAELLKAESRGRGPRPPEAVREPKKLAIYVAICLSGCDYAALARHLGMHRDTVASHCAAHRAAAADCAETEARTDGLIAAAERRLKAQRETAVQRLLSKAPSEITDRSLLLAILARMDALEASMAKLALQPTLSGEVGLHPTAPSDHENVIIINGTGRAAA